MPIIKLTDFKDPTKLSLRIIWLCYFCIFASFIGLYAGFLEYAYYYNLTNELFLNEEIAAEAEDFQEKWVSTAGILQSAIIIQLILFSMWVYRINKNSHALASKLRYTPGWSVAWFFIPIANLWKPYQVLKELWFANYNTPQFEEKKTIKFIKIFWFFAVINMSLSQAATVRSIRAKELPDLAFANKLMLLSDFIDIPFYVFSIILVIKIYKLQMNKFASKASEYQELVLNVPITEESKQNERRHYRIQAILFCCLIIFILIMTILLAGIWLDIPVE